MPQKFKDNGRALLQGSINAAATSLTVEASKADRLPVADTSDWGTPADWFKAVLIDAAGNREVVHVGTRTSGSGVLGNLLRGQDGTTALSFTAGDVVVHAIFAEDVERILSGEFDVPVTFNEEIEHQGVAGRIIPYGGIVMWSGLVADIPAGWQLCNGTNGTPDLRDKFIVGATADSGGAAKTNITGAATQSGGSKDAIVPSHTHTASSTFTGEALAAHNHTINDPGHRHVWGTNNQQHNPPADGNFGGSGAQTAAFTTTTTTGITNNSASAGTPSGTVATTVNSTGTSVTNANLPPYYALAFIMCMEPA